MLGDKVIAYFGVNPSTASEFKDDQTLRKWIGFTQRNNGSRFIVGNVFACRTKDVSLLKSVKAP